MDLPNRLPATGAGFVWEDGSLPVLRPVTDLARAAFTTRQGGVSNGAVGKLNMSMTAEQEHGDTVGFLRVFANRDLASRTIGGARRWCGVKQVHGADVVYASTQRPSADGQWTDEADRTLAVVSADCVLLLAVGPMRIGVAHAGWRGLAGGVIENIVEATEAEEVFAGPAIGPCCFEVGPEVIEAFRDRYPSAIADDRHVDLWTAAEAAAGPATFHAARICTSCHPELFFSHRRDKGITGRQALIARMP